MSVKNGEQYVAIATESILNQTFNNFEFIIVNNDSNDNTQEILSALGEKDNRIKIIKNSNNEKPSEGRMRGIKETKYDWFALMDADDESHPDRFQKQIEFINKSEMDNLAVLSTYGKYIDKNSKIVANFFSGPTNLKDFKNIYSRKESFAIIDPSVIIKKSSFLKVGGYRNETFAYDLDLYYKIAEEGYLIQTIKLPLYFYRVHIGSYSVANTMKQREISHFVNYNMRQRRNGNDEITKKQFYKDFWNKSLYRIPRIIFDYAMTYYKIAGFSLMEKRILSFFVYFILAFVLSPRYVLKRIFQQFIKQN